MLIIDPGCNRPGEPIACDADAPPETPCTGSNPKARNWAPKWPTVFWVKPLNQRGVAMGVS